MREDIVEDIEMLMELAQEGRLEGLVFAAKFKDASKTGDSLLMLGMCTDEPQWFHSGVKQLVKDTAAAGVN